MFHSFHLHPWNLTWLNRFKLLKVSASCYTKDMSWSDTRLWFHTSSDRFMIYYLGQAVVLRLLFLFIVRKVFYFKAFTFVIFINYILTPQEYICEPLLRPWTSWPTSVFTCVTSKLENLYIYSNMIFKYFWQHCGNNKLTVHKTKSVLHLPLLLQNGYFLFLMALNFRRKCCTLYSNTHVKESNI